MEALNWIGAHWIDLLQSVGIIGGLLFTAYSIRKEEKARRISNLIAISGHHREIWKELFERQELSRVLDSAVDLNKVPISEQEQLFVELLILHLSTVYQTMQDGIFVTLEGLQKDIKEFFSLPIPKAVWEKAKLLQNKDFVSLIETSRREP